MKIDLKNVTKNKRMNNIDLRVQSGDRIAIIGPNGSGKTTLLQTIMGIVDKDGGEIVIKQAKIGAVFQDNILDEALTIFQNLKFRANNYDELERAKRTIKLFGIDNFKKMYGSLSGGQKRIVNFAAAIMSSPNVIILDELSAGMDIGVRRKSWKQINKILNQKKEISLLYTTHNLDELNYANKVLFMQDGETKYFGSMTKFIRRMPKYKLVIYSGENSLEDKMNNPKMSFFDSDSEVLDYLNKHSNLKTQDFEIKHTSFDDLFLNVEVSNSEK